ncbi:MAG: outer membrane protein assembly factor BamD [Desulfosalsimonadaceae bacterium]
MKKIAAGLLCLLLAVGYGCGSMFAPETEKTAAKLASEGREAFADEAYREAIKAYSKITDWYPFSKYAEEAELKIADAHYHMEEYEQAISAYERFERLHPTDPRIDHIQYQVGRCYFDRMKGIDRDQTRTRKALKAFEKLRSRFPSSKYAKKSGKHIRKCKKTLAGHEFYVGEFYFKQERYKAALRRFQNVVDDYPRDLELHSRARSYIKRCRQEMDRRSRSAG